MGKIKIPDPITEPNQEIKKELYKLYLAIFDSNLGRKRELLIGSLYGWEKWAWRVIGISKEAVQKIKMNDYGETKGLQRDHFLRKRTHIYREMITRNKPMAQEEWWELYWKNDMTIIGTKKENDFSDGSGEYHPLNWRNGYFADKGFIGFLNRPNIEGEMIKNLKESNSFIWRPISELLNGKK